MAALTFSRHSFQSTVVVHGAGLGRFLRLVRRAGITAFAHARPLLAAAGNLLLLVWALVALAAWSLTLVGLFR